MIGAAIEYEWSRFIMAEADVVVRDAVKELEDDEGNWLIPDGLKCWG